MRGVTHPSPPFVDGAALTALFCLFSFLSIALSNNDRP
jgi:hypothetical protein